MTPYSYVVSRNQWAKLPEQHLLDRNWLAFAMFSQACALPPDSLVCSNPFRFRSIPAVLDWLKARFLTSSGKNIQDAINKALAQLCTMIF
jgi:hypothetical protein